MTSCHHHVSGRRNGLPADVAADDGGPTRHLLGDRVRHDGAGQGELNGCCVDDAHLCRDKAAQDLAGELAGDLAGELAGWLSGGFLHGNMCINMVSARSRLRLPKLGQAG